MGTSPISPGLVRQLDLRRLTVVCHDWGGPTGLGFAMSNPERVRALAVMSTWAWPTPPAEFHTRLFPWRTMHAPLVAPYLMGRHNVLADAGNVSVRRRSGAVPAARRKPSTRRFCRTARRAC